MGDAARPGSGLFNYPVPKRLAADEELPLPLASRPGSPLSTKGLPNGGKRRSVSAASADSGLCF